MFLSCTMAIAHSFQYGEQNIVGRRRISACKPKSVTYVYSYEWVDFEWNLVELTAERLIIFVTVEKMTTSKPTHIYIPKISFACVY